MRRSITNFTALDRTYENEFNSGISMTIPDQAISPQELLRRYATGVPLGLKNVEAVYDDDENFDIPEFYKMSKLDRLHVLQDSTESVIEKQNQFNKYKNELLKKQQAEKQKQQSDKEIEVSKQTTQAQNSEATKEPN